MIPKWIGTVVAGNLKIRDQESFQLYLDTLSGPVEVIVKKWRDSRSNKQNRAYWGIIINMLSQETGNDDETIHEFLKAKFLGVETVKIGNVAFQKPKSTPRLNTIEFEEYCKKIRQWAATELNIVIPEPNQIEL